MTNYAAILKMCAGYYSRQIFLRSHWSDHLTMEGNNEWT